MDFEKSLFRVYERSLANINLRDPIRRRSDENIGRTETTKYQACIIFEIIFVCVGFLLGLLLLVLHFTYVNSSGCLPSLLNEYKSVHAINVTVPSNDEILYISIDPLFTSSSYPFAYTPSYGYSNKGALLTMEDSFLIKHEINKHNITLPQSCFGGTLMQTLVASMIGYDTIIINYVMHTYKDDAVLINLNSNETWNWYHDDFIHVNIFDNVFNKLSYAITAGVAFYFMSHVTALMIRILISSGVVLIFPIIFLIQSFGVTINMRTVFQSYPWLGLEIEERLRLGRPIRPLIEAHLVHTVVYYSMYEASQIAWSFWIYNKSYPLGLQFLVFGSVMIYEYSALVYCRTITSIRFLPKYILFYFWCFHIYFYCTNYSFYFLAFFISFWFSLHIMFHFILHFEIHAASSGLLSLDRPRAMMNTTISPAISTSMPPSWTLFLPLNHTFTDIYSITVEPLATVVVDGELSPPIVGNGGNVYTPLIENNEN